MRRRRWTAIVLAIVGLTVVSLWRVTPDDRASCAIEPPDPAIAGH